MSTQYRCKNERRRTAVRERSRVNGIDYLEVAADPKTLLVYFVHPLVNSGSTQRVPPDLLPLSADNILITGGVRLQGVAVESISAFANVLMVRVAVVGDFSPYTLRLVQSPSNPMPPSGFDPQLADVTFSFWAEGISEFDCDPPQPTPTDLSAAPVIDYLAKDYASFRRLMLDRLAITAPQWRERNPSDLGVMLVELMAFAADHLSYYQDAIATEAYLGTARRRISVRRHARLLDYFMHDGCNARAWVVVRLKESLSDAQQHSIDGLTLLGADLNSQRPGVQLLSRTILDPGMISDEQFFQALNAGAQIFETLADLTLYVALDTLYFYTWDDEQCCLPQGATQATICNPTSHLQKQLTPGRVLVFEEVKGRMSGEPQDANGQHRHVVRLTHVQPTVDPLNDQTLINIAWSVEDALPFDLAISGLDPEGNPIADISVARGNVVLADAGRTIPAENVQANLGWERQRPRLANRPLTQQGRVSAMQEQWVPFDPMAAASAALKWNLRDVRPAIALWENQSPYAGNPGLQWQPQPDLLNSDRFARDFVVETEEDGHAYLRFGDGKLGKSPSPTQPLYAVYRIGNGQAGNVGANTLVNLLLQPYNLEPDARSRLGELRDAIAGVTNPLPAVGGTEPESLEQVRLYAPQAFREQRRAVTTQDYEAIAEQFPGVQKALATRRWTGSWHTIFITIDREEGRPLDEAFKQGLLTYLEEFRLAGHDIELSDPRFVPLDIAIAVQVQAEYFRSSVKRGLLDAFSRSTVEGKVGFFSPDQFTFGQAIYLSRVVATAMQVAGVQSVRVTRFQRWGEPDAQELNAGVIRLARLEIARLDNNPSTPENGRVELSLEGGL